MNKAVAIALIFLVFAFFAYGSFQNNPSIKYISATGSPILESRSDGAMLRQAYRGDDSYVEIMYPATIPYNSMFPTANEEFKIEFTCKQNDWYSFMPPWHVTPESFHIFILFQDEGGIGNYTTFELGTVARGGAPVSWRGNYDKEYVGNWTCLGSFLVDYHNNVFWGATQKDGVLTISVMNDAAQLHQGHTVWITLDFLLAWSDGTINCVHFVLGPLEVAQLQF